MGFGIETTTISKAFVTKLTQAHKYNFYFKLVHPLIWQLLFSTIFTLFLSLLTFFYCLHFTHARVVALMSKYLCFIFYLSIENVVARVVIVKKYFFF